MNKRLFPILSTWMLFLTAAHPLFAEESERSRTIKCGPFTLGQVKLLPSEFSHARDLNAAYLLQLDPDRLMARTREMCGLKAKKESYGGWENKASELGHYISACALQYAATGDERFKQRVDTIVADVAEAQQAAGDGFVGCMPKSIFERMSRGEFVVAKGLGNVPWYWLHKQYAGLIDAYELAGNQQALTVLVKFADWTDGLLSQMSDEQVQNMLQAEHGGMLESLVEIYRLSGNERYLKTADKFYHRAVFDPLAAGNGAVLDRLHANTQIPKFIGLARRYQITGNERDRKTAEFFFHYVRAHYTYANGGNSANEHFGTPDILAPGLGKEMTETCNTYNMLKLARLLFLTEPRAELMDYYEHALYNHILASQHPESGMFTYKYKLYGGYPQAFSMPFDSFWCCVGTGMENHTKYMQNIFFHDENSLWVNLFIPSELDWTARGLKVRLEAQYPDAEDVRLKISATSPTHLILRLRWPAWAEGAVLKVNGETEPLSGNPGQYVAVTRTWRGGDTLAWHLPMRAKVEALPDDPSKVALTYGPVTLAAALGRANIQIESLQGIQCSSRWNWPLPQTLPVLTALDRPVSGWLQPVAGKPLTFQIPTDAVSQPVTLIASWRANTQRYAQYLDGYTAADWNAKKTALIENQNLRISAAAQLIDEVLIGNQQSAMDHASAGEKSQTGSFRGQTWQHAKAGGWFSYEMKVKPDAPQALVVRYWGGEQRERVFDISVAGEKIATQRLKLNQPDKFFTVAYPLPEALTKGKTRVTVRFAGATTTVGGVYYIAIQSSVKNIPSN